MYKERRVPEGVKRAYSWIVEHTAADTRVMCSRNALSYYTRRMSYWMSYHSLVELPYLFWVADADEARQILGRYQIRYILVEKDRIYDDRRLRHTGGYPVSFIGKSREWPFLKPVLENEDVILYECQYRYPRT
jgi:hypothetical protein